MLLTAAHKYIAGRSIARQAHRERKRKAGEHRQEGQTEVGGGDLQKPAEELFDRSKRWHRARHLLSIATVVILGAAMSIAAWFTVSIKEDHAAELEFSSRANNTFLILQTGLDEYFNRIAALRALFQSSADGVSRNEFEIFAGELLAGQTAILSVWWIPRVTHDQRAAHELAAARDGVAGYQIRAVGPDGTLSAATERDEYFPLSYSTEAYSSLVYGLSLGDGGMRQETLERARDGGQLAASEPLTLQNGSGDRRGFFVLLPVYRQGMPHNTLEGRRRNLVGFIQGVFQTSVMLETILGAIETPIDLHLFAPGSGPDTMPIHTHASRFPLGNSEPNRQSALVAGLHWSGVLKVADTGWTLVAAPVASGAMVRNVSAWILLLAGFSLTAFVVVFMWSSSRHAFRLVQANEKISELAQTDPVTNLANRRAFLIRLTESFNACARGAPPFAVLNFDLDHFKDVNDSLGHPFGDALLQQVAERLKKVVRKTDFVARFGGDEFAVLQTQVLDISSASVLAATIAEILTAPYVIDGNQLHITISIGISQYSAELVGPEAMIMQADLALYRAKEDGRNCFRFHSNDLDQELRERLTTGHELRLAIERGELELYYQPQVEIVSRRIVGVEALVRWNHPQRGLLAPIFFIPIAERTGSIIPLGKWVFEEACRQVNLWQEQGIVPQSVAVNFSAIQCKGPDLERDIAESLAVWGIKPGTMEVELTESVLMEVTEKHRHVIERLRQLGLRIAIDDFGTGYSSLNYLTNYPVDRLKIAQELVFQVTTDCRHASVVRTAIRLAQELGIELIAEGVENDAQASFLVAAGCGYAQGYFFSRPVTAKRVTELLRQRIIEPVEKSKTDVALAAA
jgi:diguanylate cyclase (GGDEF)-like protein